MFCFGLTFCCCCCCCLFVCLFVFFLSVVFVGRPFPFPRLSVSSGGLICKCMPIIYMHVNVSLIAINVFSLLSRAECSAMSSRL